MADIIIIGGGLFGLTTALSLAENKYQDDPSRILIIDRSATPPELDAASSDINKITRGGEYADKIYSALGSKSIHKWIQDPFWSPHFYQSGIVIASSDEDSHGKHEVQASYDLLQNLYKNGQLPAPPGLLATQEAFVKAMKAPSTLVGGAPSIAYYNGYSGWSAARDSMVAVAEKCRRLGVRFERGLVESLIVKEDDVRGVAMSDGGSFLASQLVVLAASSWSAAILPELKQKVTATGQVLATIQLTPEEAKLYQNAPVYLDFKNGFYVFPTNKDGLVKFAEHAIGYTNDQPSLADKTETVSVPRTGHFNGSLSENIPKAAVDELREELKKVWPDLAEKPFKSTRMCWYCDTSDDHWITSYHDKYPSLFLATGGSGHAFKFAPVMGDLCVQGIERRLPPHLAETWSFKRERPEKQRYQNTVIQGKLDTSEFAGADDLFPRNEALKLVTKAAQILMG